MSDLRFYFDPVCPFAWLTSKWVRMVARQRDYEVEWRFISLRLLNAHLDYEAHFPAGYEAGHTAGLRLLRMCVAARAQYGPAALAGLYAELGARVFDSTGARNDEDPGYRGTAEFAVPALTAAGLPEALVATLEDDSLDAEIQRETDEALSLTGKDVGTPILHFRPPHGVAFFGPVISRLPGEDEAADLWDHVVGLAGFAGFSELKRSLRERPQLVGSGVATGEVGVQEDWHGGSRRPKH